MNLHEPKADYSDSASLRRKRLGQFFTGPRLANLLASLAEARGAESILDPMGGSGDMLHACLAQGGGKKHCAMVEVDPVAAYLARDRLAGSDATVLVGNVFHPSTLAQLPTMAFDLVITNPPYVRYQSFSRAQEGDLRLPSAIEIRNALLEVAESLPNVGLFERQLLRLLIESYSGLSDLAVPSWLLSGMLTRPGGTLAMVVPEAWLSRDYARVVHYYLLRSFHIEMIVEDAHAAWFSDALVKTTLVVARKASAERSSALDWHDEKYLHARVSSRAMNPRSVVGNAFASATDPDAAFAQALRRGAAAAAHQHPLVEVFTVPLRQKSDELRAGAAAEGWMQAAEARIGVPRNADLAVCEERRGAALTGDLARIVGESLTPLAPLTTLEAMGVSVGQGLRTGANQFFYVDLVEDLGDEIVVRPHDLFGCSTIRLPATHAHPVLRRQSEIGRGFVLDPALLRGRALILDGLALPEDNEDSCATMSEELANFVRTAARTNIGTAEHPKFIPDMSAVRTNAREAGASRGARFWYTLPTLANRHRPAIFVPRINTEHPRALLNGYPAALVDANFSTLWFERSAKIDAEAVLAVLNSKWAIAAMESSGAVMGGGALKVEATHLRRLPIPDLRPEQWQGLSILGGRLAASQRPEAVLAEIDRIVLGSVMGATQLERVLPKIDGLLRSKLDARSIRTRA